jgi:hypothetical protein
MKKERRETRRTPSLANHQVHVASTTKECVLGELLVVLNTQILLEETRKLLSLETDQPVPFLDQKDSLLLLWED